MINVIQFTDIKCDYIHDLHTIEYEDNVSKNLTIIAK